MIDMSNFTLNGTYYQAAFLFDEEHFTFRAELYPKEEPDAAYAEADNLYTLEAMGKELIAMAKKADELIRCMRGECKTADEEF